MRLKTGLIAAYLLILASFFAFPARAELTLANAALSGVYLWNVDGNSFTGELAWTPILELEGVGIRGELGAIVPNNAVGDKFFVLDYEILARIPLAADLKAEIGGGAQTWTGGNGGSSAVLQLGIAIGLGGFLDRAYASYSRFFQGGGMNELRFGLGFSFD